MSLLRNLAGQTAIYGISTIGVKLLNLFLTPYLTYAALSPAAMGAYNDIYAIIPFALVLLTMGLETGYFKFAGTETTPAGKLRVFATTWGTVILFSVVFLVAVVAFNGRIAGAMGYAGTPSYVWITAAIIALDAISAVPFSRLREERKALAFVKLRLISALLTILLCVFFYSGLPWLAARSGFWAALWDPGYGAGYAFIANLVASALILLLLLRHVSDTAPRIDRRLLGTILLFSLPLVVSGIANTANQVIDRQFIKYMIGPDALGIYGATVRLGVLMTVFTQMYRFAAEPFFLSGYSREDFVRMNADSLKYFYVVSVVIFLLMTLFIDLFSYYLGPEFRGELGIMPMVLLSNIFAGLTFNLSFWYKQTGRTKFAMWVTFTGLAFTLVLNVVLIPVLGVVGAAVARLVCEAVMMVMSWWLNRRYFPVPYDLRRIGEYTVLGAAIYGLGLLTASLPDVAGYICNFVLLSAFVLYAVRREKIDVRGLVASVMRRR